MLKKYSQKGFTIVELLIVIVIIGILAALVLNTFADSQKRARDTQRTTDVSALATQLEVYYNDHGAYPTFGQIDNPDLSEAKTAFPGLDEGALDAPSNSDKFDLVNTNLTANDISHYSYQPVNTDGTACTTNDGCAKFTLTWNKESLKTGESNPQTKKSLN